MSGRHLLSAPSSAMLRLPWASNFLSELSLGQCPSMWNWACSDLDQGGKKCNYCAHPAGKCCTLNRKGHTFGCWDTYGSLQLLYLHQGWVIPVGQVRVHSIWTAQHARVNCVRTDSLLQQIPKIVLFSEKNFTRHCTGRKCFVYHSDSFIRLLSEWRVRDAVIT